MAPKNATKKVKTTAVAELPEKTEKHFPLVQQLGIIDFMTEKEIFAIYETESGAAEIEFADQKAGKVRSVFIDNKGTLHEKRQKTFGKTIIDSLMQVEDFYKKYPHLSSKDDFTKKEETSLPPPKPAELSERRIVALSDIKVSDLTSQEHRRKRFKQSTLEELAASIRSVGLQQAPLVRPVTENTYQLIFGERRKLAAELAGLTEIEVIVRDLTETQAAEIQLTENIQRENLHPVDEAFTYQDLIAKLDCDEREVALRAGKEVGYVKNCLLLLKLDKKVMELFESEQMTFRHALEFAKYEQKDQQGLLEYCFSNFGYESQSLNPYQKFVSNIERHHLLKLNEAPFSIVSTELRKDGLACTACPQRTSAEPLLFGQNFKDEDRCLNRKCYGEKMQKHFDIQVQAVAVEKFGAEKAKQKIAEVPLLSTRYYVHPDNKPKTGRVFNSESWKEIKTDKDKCDHTETGVFFDGDRVTQKQTICTNKTCKKHWKTYSGGGNKAAATAEELEEKRMRKEEIFDVLVGEKVRRRVLKKASEKFDAENTVFDTEKFNPVVEAITDRLWHLQCHNDHHVAIVIREALGIAKSALGVGHWQDNAGGYEKLTTDQKSKMLFLLNVAHKNKLYEGGSWSSQKEVRELAEKFGIDYQLLDAEERLANARQKDKDLFRNYLHEIEAGNRQAIIPRVYSTKYKSKE